MLRSRKGVTVLYGIVLMVTLVMFVSLAVDMGRVQVAKTELRRATDAAARYGAMGLKNILNGNSAASSNAIAAAADNTVDGTPLVVSSSDVQLLIWNTATNTGTVTTDPTLANAVQVTCRRTAATGNAIPMMFARVLGFNSYDVTATSVALFTPGTSQSYTVKATGNPFLAGMPAGSQASVGNPHNNPDTAGITNTGTQSASSVKQSPLLTSIPFASGSPLSFDGIDGSASNSSSSTVVSADGNSSDIESNYTGNDNHILGMTGPLNSLVGVFLDDTQPSLSSTPTADDSACPSDYSDTTKLNRLSYAPKLKQIFFIGDGRTSDGQVQQFIPPAGATRLFLATWDGYEWNNNVGSFNATVHMPGNVTLVK
jgi:Putative Flp pilus-assembly TadE/G-like